MKKWQIEISEKSEISEIWEKLFRLFLFPSFRFCPTAKIENSDWKFLEKYFRDFWDFRGFQVFDLAQIMLIFIKELEQIKMYRELVVLVTD